MSYSLIPNIIFVIALVGVILIILRHLPAATTDEPLTTELQTTEHRLMQKGLPVIWVSKLRSLLLFWGRRGWHFVLEAKGLKPQAQVGYRIKKIFRKNPSQRTSVDAVATAVVPAELPKNEAYFLAEIKKDPKELSNYSGLALLYLDAKNYEEAKDLYEYLVKHEAGNADFHARLGYSYYLLEQFEKAVESYQKSLSLDSAHPSRHYNLGLAQRALDRNKEAAASFKQALDLEPENTNYKEALDELKS